MKEKNKHLFLAAAAFVITAAVLTLIQPPFSISALAWFAYIPFILGCQSRLKTVPLLLICWAVGFFYWLGNLYWVGFVTAAGWVVLCMYLGLYWPVIAVLLRVVAKGALGKIPLFIVFAFLIIAAEAVQGFVFGGFGWRLLGHSQYENLTLIQIADLFGVAGISFIIAMVNGLIAEVIIAAKDKQPQPIRNFFKTAFVLSVLAAVLIYGQWRLGQTDKISEGPKVAAVQTNVPLEVKESNASADEILADMLANSRQCAAAGAKLIIWPETMVQEILSGEFLKFTKPTHPAKIFDRKIAAFAKENNCFILAGALGAVPTVRDDKLYLAEKYNSAFLYRPDGTQDERVYHKIHLVPFGEYIPFTQTVPAVHKLLIHLTPYDYDYTLTAGTEYTVFEIADANDKYRFSVLICYEDAAPYVGRRMAVDKNKNKRIDWLVNISNDGWFVRFAQEQVRPSSELAQHLAVCVFRAVENRTAVLRSVNTGISCLIDSTGRIVDGFEDGTLPKKAAERKAVAGWFADTVPIDVRTTIFSKYGRFIDKFTAIIFILTAILSILYKKAKCSIDKDNKK